MSSRYVKSIAFSALCLVMGSAYGAPTTLNGLLDHIEGISPEILKARSRYEVTQQSLVQASQIPNPELGVGNWRGKAASQTWKQTDITITQPIELGGKRGSRIDVAESEIKQATVELNALVAETRLRALFILYRVRQLKDEINVLTEAKETFTHLVGNYRRRPQLSPEQGTTLFNFELALNDCELKLEDANAEFNQLEGDVKLLTGFSIAEISSLLPARKKTWPELNIARELNSPSMRILSAQAELSENELKLAKADVWPTVSIGPSYTMQNQFGEQANILGVVINFPIPVLNQNNGARAIAAKNLTTSRKLYQIEKSILEVRRENLTKTYLSSSKVLGAQADRGSLYKRHGQVESHFLKGLISSPLVLESHRQMFENQRLYHDREIKTLDVYYQLVLLEGGKIEGI